MAETSAISWTKSTFNPWIGCTAISPGCDNCYAEELDRRRFSKTLGGGSAEFPIIHFGVGAPRHRTSIHNWHQPLKWNRQAPTSEFAGRRGFWPVFCASLADVFDNEVPPAWREDLWALVAATPNLTWLIVTKRIGNVAAMSPPGGLPANVWLLVTVVNQEEADRDIPKLLRTAATVRGVSYEPALSAIDWLRWFPLAGERTLDWIIVGGESRQGDRSARPFHYEWALDTIKQWQFTDAAVFIKQLGSSAFWCGVPVVFTDGCGANPEWWPVDLRVQEFPGGENGR